MVGTKLGSSMRRNAAGTHASVSAASRIGSAGRGCAARIQPPAVAGPGGAGHGRIS